MKILNKTWLYGAAVAACIGMSAQAAEPNPNVPLIYYDMAGNATLDPSEPQNNSTYSHEALLAIYDTLFHMTNGGDVVPGLVESWTRNADLTELTMKLRKGVKFHDGTPFNADAVKRNFDRNIALGTRIVGTVRETFRLIDSYEVVDEYTVRIKLKSPSGQIEYWLGSTPGMMISPAVMTDDAFGGKLRAVGAGPYKLKNFDPNVTTITTRNDDYWEGIKGRPSGFEHHYVPDGRARLNALRSGQATIALIDAKQIPEAKSAGLTIQVVDKNAVWDIYPNTKKGPLNDLRVRQAIMYAIDREGIAEATSNGSARAARQIWSSKSPFYVKELDSRYPFDQKKAKQLLEEAGYKDGFELVDLLLNNTEYRQVGEALQANLAEVGIRIKFDVVDVSQFPLFYKPPGRGDMLMARYGGRADPISTMYELVGTGGTYAPGGAVSPEIDKIFAQLRAMAATDPKRVELMQQLSRVVSDTVATIPVISRSNVYAYKKGCILDLEPFLPLGDDKFNDVKVAKGCK